MLTKNQINLTPYSLRDAYKNEFWFIFLGVFLILSVIYIFVFWFIFEISLILLSSLLVAGFLLGYVGSWLRSALGTWQMSPIWIELKQNGVVYQRRKFWAGIFNFIRGKGKIDIPKGDPKFTPIERINGIIYCYGEVDICVTQKPKDKITFIKYLFTGEDKICIQSSLFQDVIEWFEENAPPSQEMEIIYVNRGGKKETIRGKKIKD